MHDIILRIFDDGTFHEIGAQVAHNVITGFSRVDGLPVGVVANQPTYLSGALDADSSDKAAHFVRLCDAFNIPLVFVVDTPASFPASIRKRSASSSAADVSCSRTSKPPCRR
ncbi:hypothetical protein GCM10020255_042850 [Rhodococcus baikonurensis]